MQNNYIIESSSEINGKTLVTLNRNCSSKHLKLKHVVVDERNFRYSLTHSENMLILDGVISEIIGKELNFI